MADSLDMQVHEQFCVKCMIPLSLSLSLLLSVWLSSYLYMDILTTVYQCTFHYSRVQTSWGPSTKIGQNLRQNASEELASITPQTVR